MCANLGRCVFILYLIRSVWSQGPFQITFSSNLLYSGDPVTLTFSYGSGILLSVSVDAFDGSLKKGSLSYASTPASSSGVGVFAGQTFTGWQTHPSAGTNISVTLTATPSLELNYTCTAKVFNGSSVVDGTCAPASLEVRGTAMMTHNSPVYSGEQVVLTCSYGNDNGLLSVTIDAFSRTQKEGFLWCRVPASNTTGDGVFRGRNFNGCPTLPAGSTNVSVLMIASPSLELEFNCTARVSDKELNQHILTSPPTSLVVHVMPAIPTFAPNPLTFNNGDTAVIRCESRNGKPAAAITLTVSLFNGSELATSGIDTASLTLPWPLLDWHNATATCTVTNHKFANMTTTSGIVINHISCVRNRESSSHESENVTPDCSTYISSYPAARYIWSRPHKGNSELLLRKAVFTTQLGQSENVNCTATNDIVKKRTLVVITKINKQASSRQCCLTSMPTVEPYFDKESLGMSDDLRIISLIVITISFILTLTICLVILCRRRKSTPEPALRPALPPELPVRQPSSTGTTRSGRHVRLPTKYANFVIFRR